MTTACSQRQNKPHEHVDLPGPIESLLGTNLMSRRICKHCLEHITWVAPTATLDVNVRVPHATAPYKARAMQQNAQSNDIDHHRHDIENCIEHPAISDWEHEFLESLLRQHTLTDKQMSVLERVYKKVAKPFTAKPGAPRPAATQVAQAAQPLDELDAIPF